MRWIIDWWTHIVQVQWSLMTKDNDEPKIPYNYSWLFVETATHNLLASDQKYSYK